MRTNILLFLAVCFVLCACKGMAAGPIVGGIAGGVAVLDQLLAQGVVDPVQHHQLATALQDVGKIATDAVTVAQQAQVAAAHAKDGTLDAADVTGIGVGTATVVGGILNVYRNMTRKKALAQAKKE